MQRQGVHLRSGFAHVYEGHIGRNILHFTSLNSAVEHCEQLPYEDEKLIFLHEGLYASTHLVIDTSLQIIGAGLVLPFLCDEFDLAIFGVNIIRSSDLFSFTCIT